MTLTGLHLIAGEWVGGGDSFAAVAIGDAAPMAVQSAGPAEVHRAAEVAEAAFPDFAATSRTARAAFLRAIADGIDARRDAIVPRAMAESGPPCPPGPLPSPKQSPPSGGTIPDKEEP